MLRDLVLADEMLLFACVSMYFGTGWSTALFSFPIIPKLTVDNYYLHFVPQIRVAYTTFTILTGVIVATGLVMLVDEWGTGLVWAPIAVMAMALTSATITVRLILPINRRMAAGIHDQGILDASLVRWRGLTLVRLALWTGEWLVMAIFFAVRARQ